MHIYVLVMTQKWTIGIITDLKKQNVIKKHLKYLPVYIVLLLFKSIELFAKVGVLRTHPRSKRDTYQENII